VQINPSNSNLVYNTILLSLVRIVLSVKAVLLELNRGNAQAIISIKEGNKATTNHSQCLHRYKGRGRDCRAGNWPTDGQIRHRPWPPLPPAAATSTMTLSRCPSASAPSALSAHGIHESSYVIGWDWARRPPIPRAASPISPHSAPVSNFIGL
jgi:hypothetical protein